MTKKNLELESPSLWQAFKERTNLTDRQLEQFQQYYTLLKETNDIHNLTAITDFMSVLKYHFEDSLMLGQFVDCTKLSCVADVGTGGGFPGLPLKIKYPHLQVVLIEVNFKKRAFLKEVVALLGLTDVEISELDWRTFLRKTEYPVELFSARASLQPEELLRMFKPASPYKNATLVYWASKEWTPDAYVQSFITKEEQYKMSHKSRRLIFLENPVVQE
ncbi:16S rRNA (guanine(527)-N(7))-methyltransferase RsmG [Candidatus Dependentiae bacterium]|nr:16S rRNA (guanine(527)-N(7))-methyltransferase RsmG [Candidatus Dependentiae bacterium]